MLEEHGWIVSSIGLVGSFIGGMPDQAMFGAQYVAGWIASILGAMLLLFLYRLILGKRG